MTTIDLTVDKARRARAIQRAKEKNIIIPTYAQMKDPSKIPAKIQEELKHFGLTGTTNPPLQAGPSEESAISSFPPL